jgi:hypothetical protein
VRDPTNPTFRGTALESRRACAPAWTALVGAAVLAAGCGPGARPALGSASVALSSPSSLSRVALTIGPGGGSAFAPISVELSDEGARWAAFVTGVPSGPARQFDVVAYDPAGSAAFRGSVASDVPADPGGVVIQIVLQPDAAAAGVAVPVPVIDLLWASTAAVAPGGVVTLGVSAHDPLGGALSYFWQDACGGTFAGSAGASTTWTAPAAPASCPVSVAVSAGTTSVTCSLQIAVQ